MTRPAFRVCLLLDAARMACEVEISFSPQKVSYKMLVCLLALASAQRLKRFWSQVSAVIQLVQMPPHGCTDDYPYRTPPCTPNNYLLAELGLLNQEVEVIWISDQGLHLVDKSQRDRGGGVWQWQSSIPWHLQLVGRKYALYFSIFLPMHQGSIIFYELIT